MFPGFALLSAPSSYHRGCGAGVTSVDEGVTDLALARDQIWSVMIGTELGRGFGSSLYHRRGSHFAIS